MTRRRETTLGGVALVALMLAAGFAVNRYLLRRYWGPIRMPERMARVPEPIAPGALAQRLHATGKVRYAATFVEAARIVGLSRIRAGGYRLPAKAGPLDLARIFMQGPELLKVTFPEGWTTAQMARRLAHDGFAAAPDFMERAYPAVGVSPWEGRLYPDTYWLPVHDHAQQLAEPMYRHYVQEAAKLPQPFPEVAGRRLNLWQVVTLASMVERETSVPEERPLIAGVLLNRLRRHTRLQCDATVQYALEWRAGGTAPDLRGHTPRVLWSDLKIASPYNTYLHAGLPPGPICNPGAAALHAAAAPRESNYLFYVMSPVTGRHRFAVTFAEHQHNIALVRQEQRRAATPASPAPAAAPSRP